MFDSNRKLTILHCDVLQFLSACTDKSAHALITDPPYCSVGSASQATAKKYINTRTKDKRLSFPGDTRNARSWLRWSTMWLEEARRVVVTGGVACVFVDWRQLPLATDALQCAGWVWQGIVPWDKTRDVRPRRGGFRAQCEYIVWASNGQLVGNPGLTLDGCFQFPRRAAERKYHQVGKPEELLCKLVELAPPNKLVIDPFMGGGTTAVACMRTGRRFAGSDASEHQVQISRARVDEYLKVTA